MGGRGDKGEVWMDSPEDDFRDANTGWLVPLTS